jgi:hypothetical protein
MFAADILSFNKVNLPESRDDFYSTEEDYENFQDSVERHRNKRNDDDSLFVKKIKELGSFDEAAKFISKKGVQSIFRVTIGNMRNSSMNQYYHCTSTKPGNAEYWFDDDILNCLYEDIEMESLWFFNCLREEESPVTKQLYQMVLIKYFSSFEKLFKKINEVN